MADLWSLVKGKPAIDPIDLSQAVERELGRGCPLDFRTRLLIRDSIEALGQHWGQHRLESWLAENPQRRRIEDVVREDLGAPGFPSLKSRLMSKTDPKDIEQFLREVGTRIPKPVRLAVGARPP